MPPLRTLLLHSKLSLHVMSWWMIMSLWCSLSCMKIVHWPGAMFWWSTMSLVRVSSCMKKLLRRGLVRADFLLWPMWCTVCMQRIARPARVYVWRCMCEHVCIASKAFELGTYIHTYIRLYIHTYMLAIKGFELGTYIYTYIHARHQRLPYCFMSLHAHNVSPEACYLVSVTSSVCVSRTCGEFFDLTNQFLLIWWIKIREFLDSSRSTRVPLHNCNSANSLPLHHAIGIV